MAKEEVKEDDRINMTWEISRMSFESAKHSVDQSMSFGWKSYWLQNKKH